MFVDLLTWTNILGLFLFSTLHEILNENLVSSVATAAQTVQKQSNRCLQHSIGGCKHRLLPGDLDSSLSCIAVEDDDPLSNSNTKTGTDIQRQSDS